MGGGMSSVCLTRHNVPRVRCRSEEPPQNPPSDGATLHLLQLMTRCWRADHFVIMSITSPSP